MASLEQKYYADAERGYVRGVPDPDDPDKTILPTLEQLAAHLGPDGPSVSSLAKWSKKGGWPEQRNRWRAVNQDLPTRLLRVAERRLNYLEEQIDEAKADELLKIRNIFESIRAEMAAGEEAPGVDRLAVWLEVMQDITTDLAELAPQAVELISTHFDELTKRARGRYG